MFPGIINNPLLIVEYIIDSLLDKAIWDEKCAFGIRFRLMELVARFIGAIISRHSSEPVILESMNKELYPKLEEIFEIVKWADID